MEKKVFGIFNNKLRPLGGRTRWQVTILQLCYGIYFHKSEVQNGNKQFNWRKLMSTYYSGVETVCDSEELQTLSDCWSQKNTQGRVDAVFGLSSYVACFLFGLNWYGHSEGYKKPWIKSNTIVSTNREVFLSESLNCYFLLKNKHDEWPELWLSQCDHLASGHTSSSHAEALLPLHHSSKKLCLTHGAGDADLTLSDHQVTDKLFHILNSGTLKSENVRCI